MSGGFSTLNPVTYDKQHFSELKTAVMGFMESNDRNMEEIRNHYAQHPHGHMKKSSLTQTDRMTKLESSLKAEGNPYHPVPEGNIKKRIQANHKKIGKMVANIDIDVPRLCNDFIFKKLLTETRHFYQNASSKDPDEFVR